MRADARRNYDRILAAAEDVFSEQGTDASLNEVAKRAGVGPGTLYRHFPDREALLDVLMKDWVAASRMRPTKRQRAAGRREISLSPGLRISSPTSACTTAGLAASRPRSVSPAPPSRTRRGAS